MDVEKFRPNAPRAATLLKSMGNERRLMILCYLANGEKTVGELERLIGISQSALSQHLARLRRDRLVQTRRAAQNIFYSLHGDECLTMLQTLQGYYGNAGSRQVANGR
ncbi:MAG: metalloregulator ArsR/SmtB family transcription factor [Alphaproteobacteria bacterium]